MNTIIPITCLTLIYLLPVGDTTRSFLSVTTSKLISDLGGLYCPHTDLTELVTLLVQGYHHLKYIILMLKTSIQKKIIIKIMTFTVY